MLLFLIKNSWLTRQFLPPQAPRSNLPGFPHVSDLPSYCNTGTVIIPDHDYHEREISVSVWERMLPSTTIRRLHPR